MNHCRWVVYRAVHPRAQPPLQRCSSMHCVAGRLQTRNPTGATYRWHSLAPCRLRPPRSRRPPGSWKSRRRRAKRRRPPLPSARSAAAHCCTHSPFTGCGHQEAGGRPGAGKAEGGAQGGGGRAQQAEARRGGGRGEAAARGRGGRGEAQAPEARGCVGAHDTLQMQCSFFGNMHAASAAQNLCPLSSLHKLKRARNRAQAASRSARRRGTAAA